MIKIDPGLIKPIKDPQPTLDTSIPKEKAVRQISNSSLSSYYDDIDSDEEVAQLTTKKSDSSSLIRVQSQISTNSTFMNRSSVSSLSSSSETLDDNSIDSGFNSPAPKWDSLGKRSPPECKSAEDLNKGIDWEKLYTRYINLFHMLCNGAETGEVGTFEDLEEMYEMLKSHSIKFDLEPAYHPVLSPHISHTLKPLSSKRTGFVPTLFK